MPTERWRQIEEIFSAALQQPAPMRVPFIEHRCGDPGMRDELASLLRAAEASGDFLTMPALDAFARQVSREGWTVRTGDRVGVYAITSRLGAGGMGEVWRARDERLGRDVAIKLLLPHASSVAERAEALAREARAAGALNHPNVLTVHDVGTHAGAPFIVTECLDGESLRARLARGQLPLDDALQVALQVARGLAAAHARDIVHRDLKPENIFLTAEGGVKILDFGIAALASDQGFAGGTAGYVAPEQLGGEVVDARADIFAFGAVLGEMSGGHPPADLAQIVRRCMAPVPADRCQRVPDLIAALESFVQSRNPEPPFRVTAMLRRPAVMVTVVLVMVAAAAAAWWWWSTAARSHWAQRVAPAEIRRLADLGDLAGAYLLTHEALQVAPGDPQLTQLWLDVTAPAQIISEPAGADVFLSTYRTPPSRWIPLGRTPLTAVRIPRGLARLRIANAGFDTFEGTAYPQPNMRVELVRAGSAPPGMVRVTGGRDPVRFGNMDAVTSFWIDRFEVTNREFKAFVDAGGYTDPAHWRETFVDNGRVLEPSAAIARFRDRTGRPGPATWSDGTYPEGQADAPVGGVSWYEAAAYANYAGKSLPTMYHWYRAAALGRFADILPLSNFSGEGPAPVGRHGGLGTFGTYDMAGNVKEWCWNETGNGRFLLGGAWNELRYMFADFDARGPFERAANFGFRLARYDAPLSAAHLAPVEVVNPVAAAAPGKPVSDEVFDVYRRQAAYDRTPLNATVEATEETALFTRVIVTFDAAYNAERVRAHLFLPRGVQGRLQAVVYFPGNDAFRLPSSRDMALGAAELIVRSGRAFFYPVYKGTYERHVRERTGTNAYRELRIAWARDLGRSIDYLESRADIDRDRLAYYGISVGGNEGVFLTALEPRLKASVLQGTGLFEDETPELAMRNYAPRIKLPTLVIGGRYDFEAPFETTQRPLFELIGTPAEHKKLVAVEAGHSIPTGALHDAILPWLDRYLGPVVR